MAKTADFDVAYISKLARLNLSKEETRRFQKQLADVLKYAEKLREVDVGHVEAAGRVEELAPLSIRIVGGDRIAHRGHVELAARLTGAFDQLGGPGGPLGHLKGDVEADLLGHLLDHLGLGPIDSPVDGREGRRATGVRGRSANSDEW